MTTAFGVAPSAKLNMQTGSWNSGDFVFCASKTVEAVGIFG
jgi:hypothetical protein